MDKEKWDEIVFDVLLQGSKHRVESDNSKLQSSDCCVRCSGDLPKFMDLEEPTPTEVGYLCPGCNKEIEA